MQGYMRRVEREDAKAPLAEKRFYCINTFKKCNTIIIRLILVYFRSLNRVESHICIARKMIPHGQI